LQVKEKVKRIETVAQLQRTMGTADCLIAGKTRFRRLPPAIHDNAFEGPGSQQPLVDINPCNNVVYGNSCL
jgi:hypothetical protein